MFRRSLVPVTPETFPNIDRLVSLACSRLGVRRPAVSIQPEVNRNAFAPGFEGKHGQLVLTKGILAFPDGEMLFILGHELGHLARWHSPISTAIHFISSYGRIPAVSWIVSFVSASFSIRAEFSADRFGLVAVDGDEATACRSLIRDTGSGDIPPAAIGSDDSWYTCVLELFGTHPFLGRRLKQLQQFGCEMYR